MENVSWIGGRTRNKTNRTVENTNFLGEERTPVTGPGTIDTRYFKTRVTVSYIEKEIFVNRLVNSVLHITSRLRKDTRDLGACVKVNSSWTPVYFIILENTKGQRSYVEVTKDIPSYMVVSDQSYFRENINFNLTLSRNFWDWRVLIVNV